MDKLLRTVGRAIGLVRKIEPQKDEAEFIAEAIRRFELAAEAEKDQREHELACLRMCDPNQQWDESIKAGRTADERPCMTEDRINPFTLQVCNSLRQNRAAVQVNPVDDRGDVDTAETIQGLIRHITYESSADMAYDTSSTSMVRVGRGYYRVITEYESDDSFDQVIRVKAIPNHHMVYVDPNAIEMDYSDAEWFMVFEDMDRATFKREFPMSKLAESGRTQWQSVGDDAPGWADDDYVRVVEYFYKTPKKTKICRLSTGETVEAKDLPEGIQAREGEVVSQDEMGNPVTIDAVRDSMGWKVNWCKLTAAEVLERQDYPGTIIPIVPMLGKELNISGKRRYFGLVAGMIDPQKRFNWLLSAQLETINLVPRAPWIAVEGSQVNPSAWANSHRRTTGSLTFKQSVDGVPVTMAPQRGSVSVDISAVNQALMGAAEGLKGTSGLYNPSIGATETTSQSGVAIRAQQSQGDMATFHFQDAVTRARRKEGRIILDLIPKIYDAQRVLRIVNEDETAKTVMVNGQDRMDPNKPIIDLTVGKYDLTVTAGPSYTTRRQENLAVLMSMADKLPQLFQVAPDLLVSQLDVPIAKPLAKRLKAALPPGTAQDEAPQGPDPHKLMAQHQQSQQMIQQLTEALKVAQDEKEEKQLDREAKIMVAKIQAQANVTGRFIQSESTQLGADSRALLDFDREIHMTSLQQASQPTAGQPGEAEEAIGPAGEPAGMEEA